MKDKKIKLQKVQPRSSFNIERLEEITPNNILQAELEDGMYLLDPISDIENVRLQILLSTIIEVVDKRIYCNNVLRNTLKIDQEYWAYNIQSECEWDAYNLCRTEISNIIWSGSNYKMLLEKVKNCNNFENNIVLNFIFIALSYIFKQVDVKEVESFLKTFNEYSKSNLYKYIYEIKYHFSVDYNPSKKINVLSDLNESSTYNKALEFLKGINSREIFYPKSIYEFISVQKSQNCQVIFIMVNGRGENEKDEDIIILNNKEESLKKLIKEITHFSDELEIFLINCFTNKTNVAQFSKVKYITFIDNKIDSLAIRIMTKSAKISTERFQNSKAIFSFNELILYMATTEHTFLKYDFL